LDDETGRLPAQKSPSPLFKSANLTRHFEHEFEITIYRHLMATRRGSSEYSRSGSDHPPPTKAVVTPEEAKQTRSQIYGMLLEPVETKIAAISSLITGVPPALLYVIVSRVVTHLSRAYTDPTYDVLPTIQLFSIYMAIVAVVNAIFKYIATLLWVKAGSALSVKMRNALFENMMRCEVEYFDKNPIGGILTLLSEDARTVQDAFGPIKGTQLQVIGTFISAVVSHFTYSWRTALIYLSTLVVVAVVVPLCVRAMAGHVRLKFIHLSKTMTIADETFSSIRTVRSFNRESKEVERFHMQNGLSQGHERKAGYILNIGKFVSAGVYWGTLLGNFYYVGTLAADPSTGYTVGDILAVFGCQLMGNFSIISIQASMQTERKAISAGSRILKMCRYRPAIPFDEGTEIENFKGNIEFKHVSFKYPSRDAYVLKNVSFKVKAGETAALVGHSGSGKSTCIQLLERFYDVTEGMIMLDGVDIREINPRWLHRQMALVSQDPVLFHASVRDNIIYGSWEATDAQVIEAATTANALKFINAMPKKYDEMIGERGSTLSGGQRQRIAIARAVVKQPVILLTDEATSALDAESENDVQRALEIAMQGRTAIIVAHRLSTIRNAKVIHVFDDGAITERGTHEELVEKRGFYYNLVSRQLTKSESTEPLASPGSSSSKSE
jgi:ABC-type multidrug transport system fused ATPase/permease subunit